MAIRKKNQGTIDGNTIQRVTFEFADEEPTRCEVQYMVNGGMEALEVELDQPEINRAKKVYKLAERELAKTLA